MEQDKNSSVSTYPIDQNARPEAIVVYCSDPRFQYAFDQFIEKQLNLEKGKFVPFVIGGGAGVLANPLQLPKEFKFIKERLEMFFEHFPSIKKVVLINHEDCKYYAQLAEKLKGIFSALGIGETQQRKDLFAISQIVLRHVNVPGGVDFELYYARFADAEKKNVDFERILLAKS